MRAIQNFIISVIQAILSLIINDIKWSGICIILAVIHCIIGWFWVTKDIKDYLEV